MAGQNPDREDWRTIFSAPRSVGCHFCEIVEGRRGAHVVFREEQCVAFLDSRPLFLGHTLVVPTAHYETLADLPDRLVATLFARVKALAKAVQEATASDGTFVAINNRVSQSVPHLHVHVVPRRFGDGLRGFFWPRTKYESDEQAEQICAKIRRALGEAETKQD